MLVAGNWVEREKTIKVYNPENQELIATVPSASKEDVALAIEEGIKGAEIARKLSTNERMTILNNVVKWIEENQDLFLTTLVNESSKTIREAKKEVKRCIETIKISAEEARRIHGKTIPFDQMEGNENRLGYYMKVPVGLIVAITPFNDPLNLVAHKLGPAIASGNAIILKPSSETPLSALLLARAFKESGLPNEMLSVITGSSREIGEVLVTHEAIRMITFTGGYEAGEDIFSKAKVKKISMELGSNSPCIVLKDANFNLAVNSVVSGAFWAAGQNCLGVQRVYVEEDIFDKFKHELVLKTSFMKVGSKLEETSDMGPLINEKEAIRVEHLVESAKESGAECLIGGKRNGSYYLPTVLTNVPPDHEIVTQEIFGPVVIIEPIINLEEGIEKANNVSYGLQAGIFTKNIENAFHAVNNLNYGGVMVNDSSDFRIDAMPFGGMKKSGIGREGVPFTIEEMTETRVVCFKI